MLVRYRMVVPHIEASLEDEVASVVVRVSSVIVSNADGNNNNEDGEQYLSWSQSNSAASGLKLDIPV